MMMTDGDLYDFTVQKAILDCFSGVPVTYKLFNRNPNQIFTEEFHDRLRRDIDKMSQIKLEEREENFLYEKCPFLGKQYLSWLRNYRFNPQEVETKIVNNQLDLQIKGEWQNCILFEVKLLALICENYFNLNNEWYNNNLKDYISKINMKGEELNGINFTDFGTRRRRSFKIHDEVVKTLSKFSTFKGTSNILLAMLHNTRPVGTMSHQFIMGISALEGLRHANRFAMHHWSKSYKGNLGTYLPDTFGTDCFWEDFDGYYARLFDSLRHDSGDPFEFGNKTIEHYKNLGINPMSKYIIFSNGLDWDDAVDIHNYFKRHINVSFGIGTKFTNDFPDALNIVIKMTTCNGIPVVKLSDSPSKSIGDRDALRVARWTFFNEPLDKNN